jgi:hypothetical protein
MYYGEKLNAWTHLVGAVLALGGAVVLIVVAALDGDAWKITSVSIYGVTLVLLYSFSALYHSFRGRAKDILRKLDHLSIYLLIAGSYTPFCLVTLRGPWGWSLLGTVWALAILGSLQEMRPRNDARHPLAGDLHRDGVGSAGRPWCRCSRRWACSRFHLGRCRWCLLHRRHHLLCSRYSPVSCARYMASVRDGR